MKIAEYNEMMAYLTRPEPQPTINREDFAFGTEKPITPNNDLGNIQVADLKDDLTPGPLKDELDGKYDPSQETHEDYLRRINLERPFNASLEESTTGPGGYPMTAGLNILKLPKAYDTVKKATDLIQSATTTPAKAKKIALDFFKQRQPYGGANQKKDYSPEKKFLSVLKSYMNKFNPTLSGAAEDLGISRNTLKGISERINQQETGLRTSNLGFDVYSQVPKVPEPVNGIEFKDMTTLMKRDPDQFKVLIKEKDEFLNPESMGHYLGIKFARDDKGIRTGIGKFQYDQLSEALRDLNVKKNKQGEYSVNDAINKLLDKNKNKIIKDERKSDRGLGRYKVDSEFDPELFKLRNNIKTRISNRSQGLDTYLPNAVDDVGHPFSLTKSQEKYKKLFKDSNMNQINTLVYQDNFINTQLFKNSGYERKYEKMFDKLLNIQNKKVTPQIQNQLLEIKKDMNDNYNYIQNIIKDPKLLDQYINKNSKIADKKFINYLTNQGDRVQKIDIKIPKVGDKFKSEDIFVDMSVVNPKYIMGYINNINPNAKKFKDLSLSEQELYRNNVMQQNAEIVSEYYKKAKFPEEDIEAVKETVGMEYAKGGRVGFNEGKLAKIGNVAGKTFAGLDTPALQALFATSYEAGEDPLWYTIPAALTETANKYLNLYEKSPGKAKNFIKSVLRLMPIEQAQKFYPVFSKLGKVGSTTGYPFLKAASEALKEIKVRGETERAAADFKMSPQKMKELRSKSILSSLPDIKDDAYVPTEQDYSEANEKIQKARDAFALQAKILGSFFGLTEDPLAEKESIYTRGKQVPMSLERVQEGSRAGFEDGTDPKKPKGLGSLSKGNFLKTLALIPAGIMAIKGGPNLLKKAAATKKAIAAKGMPEWFGTLVDKVIQTGTDVTKQFATKDREVVHVKQLGEAEGVRVTQDLETGAVRVDYDSPTNMGEQSVSFTYRPATQLEEGKTVPAQFEAVEAEPRGIRMGPDDYDIEFDGENIVESADELMSDTSSLKQFATGKLDEMDLKIRQDKLKKVQDLNENQMSQAEYLETKYGPGDDVSYKQFPDDD